MFCGAAPVIQRRNRTGMSSMDSPTTAGDARSAASARLSQPLPGLPRHQAGPVAAGSEVSGGAASALGIRPARRIKSVQMTIKEQLVGEIISGRLAPGTRLNQADLAHQLGVSLTPIREALRELCSEGLADIDPFVGVTVHRPTLDSLRDVYEMRSALEPLTIPRSGWRLSADQLAVAAKLIGQMDQETDPASWTAVNRAFHNLLRSNSRNQRALVTLERLEICRTCTSASPSAPVMTRTPNTGRCSRHTGPESGRPCCG